MSYIFNEGCMKRIFLLDMNNRYSYECLMLNKSSLVFLLKLFYYKFSIFELCF